MIKNLRRLSSLALCAGLLAGCTNMNIFKDSPSSAPAPQPNLGAQPPMSAPAVSGALSAAEIRKALSGKSWKWSGPNNSGVTLYADDGSSLVEVTGRGTTTGKWEARDGQLCESFSAAAFLPKGVPMTCQPVTRAGTGFKVGQATFTLA